MNDQEANSIAQLVLATGLVEVWCVGERYRVDAYSADGVQVSEVTCDDRESAEAVLATLLNAGRG